MPSSLSLLFYLFFFGTKTSTISLLYVSFESIAIKWAMNFVFSDSYLSFFYVCMLELEPSCCQVFVF
jgi:hypothetical protein